MRCASCALLILLQKRLVQSRQYPDRRPAWMRFLRAQVRDCVVGVARPGAGNNAIKGLQRGGTLENQCPNRELVNGRRLKSYYKHRICRSLLVVES